MRIVIRDEAVLFLRDSRLDGNGLLEAREFTFHGRPPPSRYLVTSHCGVRRTSSRGPPTRDVLIDRLTGRFLLAMGA